MSRIAGRREFLETWSEAVAYAQKVGRGAKICCALKGSLTYNAYVRELTGAGLRDHLSIYAYHRPYCVYWSCVFDDNGHMTMEVL